MSSSTSQRGGKRADGSCCAAAAGRGVALLLSLTSARLVLSISLSPRVAARREIPTNSDLRIEPCNIFFNKSSSSCYADLAMTNTSSTNRSSSSSLIATGSSGSNMTERPEAMKVDEERSRIVGNRLKDYVFIADEEYSWLPAKILSRPSSYNKNKNSNNDESHLVKVQVMTPGNWDDTTILSSSSRAKPTGRHKSPSQSSSRTSRREEESSSIRLIDLAKYTGNSLPLQNLIKATWDGTTATIANTNVMLLKPDMADLPNLHEAAVLYNLKELYCNPPPSLSTSGCVPYTRVGDIVVALNPFVWMKDLYSTRKQAYYADALIWSIPPPMAKRPSIELTTDASLTLTSITTEIKLYSTDTRLHESSSSSREGMNTIFKPPEQLTPKAASFFTKSKYYSPHIYETTALAFRSMIYHQKNQTILVSGESGAGKTETVKLCMSHLAFIQSMDGKSSSKHSTAVMVDCEETGSFDTQPNTNLIDQQPSTVIIPIAATSSNIVERVLESNPLFEAFGCATTLLNDNSSRFGKFTSLIFQLSNNNKERLLMDEMEDEYSSTASSEDSSSCNDVDFRHERKDNGNGSNHKYFVKTPRGILVGSTTETYLLEKSRVVTHGPEERSYHIFYQLLSAPEDHKVNIWEGLKNTTFNSFKYIATQHNSQHNDTILHDGKYHTRPQLVEDAEGFLRTVKDLALFNIVGDEFLELMRALCIVMQLGNLTFGGTSDNNDSSQITSPTEELEKLSSLMGSECTLAKLEAALTTRVMEARGESFFSHLTPIAAKDGCDALAKEIYARIFDYLVDAINNATSCETRPKPQKKHQSFSTISILDMFGFERFDTNRFEQLCINYANEKLQQKYVMDNFLLVQAEYIEEGIELFDLAIVDNSQILDVIEGPMGVIDTLNDECIRPNGSDASFVYKIKAYYKDNNRLSESSNSNSSVIISEKLHLPVQFGVKHFIGTVTYDATKIVEVNNDLLPKDLIELFVSLCSNKLVNSEFKKLQESRLKAEHSSTTNRRLTNTKNRTVAGKFRSQLTSLMLKISESRTRYIRCIRPNKEMQPGKLDHLCTTRQLISAGLVTAIAISRETFPDRLEYKDVLDRFLILVPAHCNINIGREGDKHTTEMIKFWAKQVLEVLLSGFVVDALGTIKEPYACGKTRIYFRTGALEHLEVKREQYYGVTATIIQRFIRCKLLRWNYLCKMYFGILLQVTWRTYHIRMLFSRKLQSIIIVQSRLRGWLYENNYKKSRLYFAGVAVQRRYRCWILKGKLLRLRLATVKVQRWHRVLKNKVRFNSALAKCIEDARMNHEMKSLRRKFALLGRREGSHELFLLADDCTKLLEYAVSEMFKLRRKNADVSQELSELKERNHSLTESHQSLEAAVSLSNRQVVQMGRSNSALVAEVAAQTKKAAIIEKKMKQLQQQHAEELKSVRDSLQEEISVRDVENAKLLKSTEKIMLAHKKDMRRAEKLQKRAEEKSFFEVEHLRKELRDTQEAHHDYLNKLMDVVENAHMAREAEEARITEEFHARLYQKDHEIAKLRSELSALKKAATHRSKGYNI